MVYINQTILGYPYQLLSQINKIMSVLKEASNEAKKEFNYSIFFSTEISASSVFPKINESGKPTRTQLQNPTGFCQDPYRRYLRTKQESKQAKIKFWAALHDKIRAQSSLKKIQKDSSICRQQFLKIYTSKEFKLRHNDLIGQNKIKGAERARRCSEQLQKKKMYDELSHLIMLNKRDQGIQEVRLKNMQENKEFRIQLREINEQIYKRNSITTSCIKQGKHQFVIRKKDMTHILRARAKLNYISKVSDELNAIKEYQYCLDDLEEDAQQQQMQNERSGVNTPVFSMTQAISNSS